jgi:hypothetical protein
MLGPGSRRRSSGCGSDGGWGLLIENSSSIDWVRDEGRRLAWANEAGMLPLRSDYPSPLQEIEGKKEKKSMFRFCSRESSSDHGPVTTNSKLR